MASMLVCCSCRRARARPRRRDRLSRDPKRPFRRCSSRYCRISSACPLPALPRYPSPLALPRRVEMPNRDIGTVAPTTSIAAAGSAVRWTPSHQRRVRTRSPASPCRVTAHHFARARRTVFALLFTTPPWAAAIGSPVLLTLCSEHAFSATWCRMAGKHCCGQY
jgi:hypothetical protein